MAQVQRVTDADFAEAVGQQRAPDHAEHATGVQFTRQQKAHELTAACKGQWIQGHSQREAYLRVAKAPRKAPHQTPS